MLTALFIVPAALVFGLNLTQGPTLLFDTLPQLFHRLPFGTVFGSAFLIGLIMVAFLSNVAALEVLYASAEDLPGRPISGARRLLLIGVLEAVLIIPSAFHPAVIAYLDLIFGSGMQGLGCAFAVIALTLGWVGALHWSRWPVRRKERGGRSTSSGCAGWYPAPWR